MSPLLVGGKIVPSDLRTISIQEDCPSITPVIVVAADTLALGERLVPLETRLERGSDQEPLILGEDHSVLV